MHTVRPDDKTRDAASMRASSPAPSSAGEKPEGLSISTDRISVASLESSDDPDIPALLEPYRTLSDDYVASQPTPKEQKQARERQKRRERRRADLDKRLERHSKKHPTSSPEEVFRAVFPKVERKRTKRKRPIGSILIMLFGALLLAFPIVSDLYANWQAEQAITSYTQQIASMTQEEKDAMMAKAIAYNHRLAGESLPDDADIDGVDYYDILDTTGTGIMGAVMIECIGVNQPIYHGTEEDTLMAGVGHLEGSSFPIPTGASNAAIAGHTGMPGQRMFDELVDLEPGDKLHVKILDRDTWYQVIDSEVVDPDQKNTFAPEHGRDLLTLITCTPYGINDHRLLVHCERIDVSQNQTDFGVVTEDKISKYVNLRTLPVMITVALLLFGVIWKLLKTLRKKTGKRKKEEEERARRKAEEMERAISVGGRMYAEHVSLGTSPEEG